MKKRIEEMIKLFESGFYDPESAHMVYDILLEQFIAHYDPELLPLMKHLMSIKKDFWYA